MMTIRARVQRQQQFALGMLVDLYELGVDVGEEIVDMDIAIHLR